ncbi:MAG: hypothetical protein KDI98_01270 [Hyphomicrobiaceae bacterium]|nr:hypothetical protein [Hyphomicrobiaceae bacterium]
MSAGRAPHRGLCSAVALLALAMLAGCDEDAPQAPPDPPREQAVPAAPPEPQTRTVTLPPVRQVTPDRVLPGPVITGEVERMPDPPPPPPRPRRYDLGVIGFIEPDLIEGRDGLRMRLKDVALPPESARCAIPSGGWRACADLALIGIRRVVRLSRVECVVEPEDRSPDADTPPRATCFIGENDIARRLIGLGWIGAADGAPQGYRDAALAARANRRGLYRLTGGDPFAP